MAFSAPREKTQEEKNRHKAIVKLQAQWRGHLARGFTDRLRWQSKSKLQRTFSWGKKGKRKGAKTASSGAHGIKERSAKDILASAGVDDAPKKNVVKRSMSFDRFSRGVKSIVGGSDKSDSAGAPAAAPTKSKQLLFILLQRGPTGLGLELD